MTISITKIVESCVYFIAPINPNVFKAVITLSVI